jgi:hypothetical protein
MRTAGIPLVLALGLSLGAAGTAQAQWGLRVEALGVLESDDATSDSFALDLDNHGVVLGFSNALGENVPLRAFVLETGPMRGLGNQGGLTSADALDIDDRGQIVGPGRMDGPQRAFDATPAPAPEMNGWALLLAGLGGIAIVVSHRRRSGP